MSFKDLPIMQDKKKGVLLFYPYVSKKSGRNVKKNLPGDGLGRDQWLISSKMILKKSLPKIVQ